MSAAPMKKSKKPARKRTVRVSLAKVEQQFSPILQRAIKAARDDLRREFENERRADRFSFTPAVEAVMLKLQDIDHVRAAVQGMELRLPNVVQLRENLAVQATHNRRLLAVNAELHRQLKELQNQARYPSDSEQVQTLGKIRDALVRGVREAVAELDGIRYLFPGGYSSDKDVRRVREKLERLVAQFHDATQSYSYPETRS